MSGLWSVRERSAKCTVCLPVRCGNFEVGDKHAARLSTEIKGSKQTDHFEWGEKRIKEQRSRN